MKLGVKWFQVEKGRLAVECPPEITKHLMDIEVSFRHIIDSVISYS